MIKILVSLIFLNSSPGFAAVSCRDLLSIRAVSDSKMDLSKYELQMSEFGGRSVVINKTARNKSKVEVAVNRTDFPTPDQRGHRITTVDGQEFHLIDIGLRAFKGSQEDSYIRDAIAKNENAYELDVKVLGARQKAYELLESLNSEVEWMVYEKYGLDVQITNQGLTLKHLPESKNYLNERDFRGFNVSDSIGYAKGHVFVLVKGHVENLSKLTREELKTRIVSTIRIVPARAEFYSLPNEFWKEMQIGMYTAMPHQQREDFRFSRGDTFLNNFTGGLPTAELSRYVSFSENGAVPSSVQSFMLQKVLEKSRDFDFLISTADSKTQPLFERFYRFRPIPQDPWTASGGADEVRLHLKVGSEDYNQVLRRFQTRTKALRISP